MTRVEHGAQPHQQLEEIMHNVTTLALNGATPNYKNPVVALVSTPAARICAGLADLFKQREKENIGADRFKALLDGYARGVLVTGSPDIKDPRDQKWIRTAFSVAYTKISTQRAIDLMLNKGAKSTALADVLAAFGGAEDGTSMISDKMMPAFKAAASWSDESITSFAR